MCFSLIPICTLLFTPWGMSSPGLLISWLLICLTAASVVRTWMHESANSSEKTSEHCRTGKLNLRRREKPNAESATSMTAAKPTKIAALAIAMIFSVSMACTHNVVHAQQITAQQVNIPVTNPASPVQSASATLVGNPGNVTYYYWAVSNALLGPSNPYLVVTVLNAPITLSGSNYVKIAPNYNPTVTSIDLLRTTTNAAPSGACNCAVATSQTGTINDQSNSLSAYTVASAPDPSLFGVSLTNEPQGSSTSDLILRQNGTFVTDLSTAAGGGNFGTIGSGTASGKTFTVGNGTTLSTSGTGVNNANQINGATVPVSKLLLGSNSSGQTVGANLSEFQIPEGSATANTPSGSQLVGADTTLDSGTDAGARIHDTWRSFYANGINALNERNNETSTVLTITTNPWPVSNAYIPSGSGGDTDNLGGVFTLPTGAFEAAFPEQLGESGVTINGQGSGAELGTNYANGTHFIPATPFNSGTTTSYCPFVFAFGICPGWSAGASSVTGPYASKMSHFGIDCLATAGIGGLSFSGQEQSGVPDWSIQNCRGVQFLYSGSRGNTADSKAIDGMYLRASLTTGVEANTTAATVSAWSVTASSGSIGIASVSWNNTPTANPTCGHTLVLSGTSGGGGGGKSGSLDGTFMVAAVIDSSNHLNFCDARISGYSGSLSGPNQVLFIVNTTVYAVGSSSTASGTAKFFTTGAWINGIIGRDLGNITASSNLTAYGSGVMPQAEIVLDSIGAGIDGGHAEEGFDGYAAAISNNFEGNLIHLGSPSTNVTNGFHIYNNGWTVNSNTYSGCTFTGTNSFVDDVHSVTLTVADNPCVTILSDGSGTDWITANRCSDITTSSGTAWCRDGTEGWTHYVAGSIVSGMDSAGNITGTNSIKILSNGTNAALVAFAGNTASTAGLPLNSVGWMGPTSASFPSYFLQIPSTAPSGGQVLSFQTPSGSISTGTWTTPLSLLGSQYQLFSFTGTNTGSGNSNIVTDASNNLKVSAGIVAGSTASTSIGSGVVDAITGFQINGAAPSGHFPCGNGTDYIDCTPGIVPNPQTGTTYTYSNTTDRGAYTSFSNASAIAVTLPQAGVTILSNWANVSCDIGAGTATITPSTSTISYTNGSAYTSGASSLALTTGQCAWIYSDNTNYFAIKISAYALPSQYKTWSSPDGIISNAALPTSGFPGTPFGLNKTGATETITAISCAVDGGSSTTVALTDGSGNNLLSGSTCTCSTSWASCSQSGTNTTISSGGYMKATYTPDGTAKAVSLVVSGTY